MLMESLLTVRDPKLTWRQRPAAAVPEAPGAPGFRSRCRSVAVLGTFCRGSSCWKGLSRPKDSVIVAHAQTQQAQVALVHVAGGHAQVVGKRLSMLSTLVI